MGFQALWVSVAIGVMTVLQAGLNRKTSTIFSLPVAILVNASVLLVFSIGFLLLSGRDQFLSSFSQMKWWVFLPGIFGFCIVSGIPLAISKQGSLQTFLIIVVSQIATSVIWDYVAESTPPSNLKLLGAGISVLGVWISTLK